MINTVRRVLLLVTLSVIGLAGFYFFKALDTSISIGNMKIKVMEKGIDVEIENFKVSHENKGVKDWELKADLAQIYNDEDLTKLQNVEMVVHKEKGGQYIISADSGVYKSETKDVTLDGNVKLLGPTGGLKKRLQANSKKNE